MVLFPVRQQRVLWISNKELHWGKCTERVSSVRLAIDQSSITKLKFISFQNQKRSVDPSHHYETNRKCCHPFETISASQSSGYQQRAEGSQIKSIAATTYHQKGTASSQQERHGSELVSVECQHAQECGEFEILHRPCRWKVFDRSGGKVTTRILQHLWYVQRRMFGWRGIGE